MKPFFAILGLMILLNAYSFAQQNKGTDYKTSLGLKYYPGSMSFKHFIKKNTAIEALWRISADGVRFTGLYELHKKMEVVEGVKWYMGGGGHFGIWSDSWKSKYPASEGGFAFGIDGVIGLDYKIEGVPVNLSLDWQPSINLIGYTYFEGDLVGLAIRYTF